MRKNLNKLATLALSGMMVMSMAMPAFAAIPSDDLNVKFTKKLFVDGETLAPRTTFNFKITNGEAGDWDYLGKDNQMHNMKTLAGIGGVTVEHGAKFAPARGTAEEFGKVDGDVHYFEADAAIKLDSTVFDRAEYGTYTYNLTEINDKYEGVNYSTSEFKIYVTKFHDETGDHLVTKVVRTKLANTKLTEEQQKKYLNEKVSVIYNNYGRPTPPPENPDIPPVTPPGHEDPNDTTHVVHIAKKITGNGSNESKKFKFEVYVIPASTTGVTENEREQYAVINEGAENLPNNAVISASTQNEYDNGTADKVTFDAGQGKGIKITGLTKGDKVVVKEIDSDTSYTVTAGEDESNYTTTGSMQAGSRINKSAITVTDRTLDFNVLKNEAKVVVTNTKGNVTPTGIVMNVAPYALMLAVAGGLGVVFVNRKKEEE